MAFSFQIVGGRMYLRTVRSLGHPIRSMIDRSGASPSRRPSKRTAEVLVGTQRRRLLMSIAIY